MKNLKHLQFKASEIGNAGVEELIKSGLLGRLKVLDLTYGCINDEGAEMLANAPETKNLDQLILDGNGLSNAGIRAIRKSGVNVKAEQQLSISDDDDYQEYLGYGDPE